MEAKKAGSGGFSDPLLEMKNESVMEIQDMAFPLTEMHLQAVPNPRFKNRRGILNPANLQSLFRKVNSRRSCIQKPHQGVTIQQKIAFSFN